MGSRKRKGPPSELTAEVHKLIVDAVLAGNYLDTVAGLAGFAEWTVRRWIVRGVRERERRERGRAPKTDEDRYVALAHDIAEAESKSEKRAVLQLVNGGKKDWHASLAFLERRYPRKWGQKVNVTLEEEFDAFFAKLERKLPPELFERVLRAVDEPDGEGSAGTAE